MMMAASMLAATSCSDYSDYNEAVADATQSANLTLWENIQQTPELSDFASLVKRAGFADELNATSSYTVWAPKNGTFDVSDYESLSNSALLQQFVKNHIASYAHRASGTLEERVLMLNEKSYDFAGTASYTFDGVPVVKANVPSNNGVMHILGGDAKFYPNLYEFVTDSILAEGKDIDSLRNYFLRYERTYLDENASVVGPIVNGMQTWVDSVMVTTNSLWNTLNARINNEDSTYTFVMPTNTAWNEAYDNIKGYYKYAAKTVAQAYTSNGLSANNSQISINNTYWQDSITSRILTRYLIYSNNDAYNKWMIGGPSYSTPDSLRTTTRAKLSEPQYIVGSPREILAMSNGRALIVDQLGMRSWDTYAPERTMNARNSTAYVSGGTQRNYTVAMRLADDKDEFSYTYIEATGYNKPEQVINLSNVLSTTYDIYCVFVPAYDQLTLYPDTIWCPNRVIFTLSYCDAKGNLVEKEFLDESEENISGFMKAFPSIRDNTTNAKTIRAFSNNPAIIDTIFVGRFEFPVCYSGLGSNYCPTLKISTPFAATNRTLRTAFTRDLRIASVIMKPKELVAYEESKKQ